MKCVVIGITFAVATTVSSLCLADPSYDLAKQISIVPNPAAAANPTVTAYDFEHAWWQTPTDGGTASSPNQNLPFDFYGYEAFLPPAPGKKVILQNVDQLPDKNGKFAANANLTPVDLNQTAVPNGGLNQTFTAAAGPAPKAIHASASTIFSVAKANANQPYAASIEVKGTADPKVQAYAFSEGFLRYKDAVGVLKNARINVLGTGGAGRAGTDFAKNSRTWDPISFEMLDSGGNVLASDTLMNLLYSVDGNGSITSDSTSGAFHIDTQGGSAAIHLSVSDLYVSSGEGGSLDLEIDDGLVTQSSATGRYAGKLLPTLGSTVSSWDSLTLTQSDLTFDLALDSAIPTGTDSIALDVEEAAFVATPEPGSLLLIAAGGGILLRRRRSAQG